MNIILEKQVLKTIRNICKQVILKSMENTLAYHIKIEITFGNSLGQIKKYTHINYFCTTYFEKIWKTH
jgi:hypothetical protein